MKNKLNKSVLRDSIFLIGRVSGVEGRRIKIKVKKDKNLSHLSYCGNTIKNVSVGSYIKIVKGFIKIVGKVEGEYTKEESLTDANYRKNEMKISRFLDVSLYGYFDNDRVRMGIREMPLIDNECYLLDKNEFDKIHNFYSDKEKTIEIGNLTEDSLNNISVSINKLFASHIGIFGNTGSGKSNTLTTLFSKLFKSYEGNPKKENFKENSHFIIVDFNGEYTKDKIITTDKIIYNLNGTGKEGNKKRYPIKEASIKNFEIISILLEATEKTQKPFLSRAINNNYLNDAFDKRSKQSIKEFVTEILEDGGRNISQNILHDYFDHLKHLVTKKTETFVDKILENLDSGMLKHQGMQKTYYVTIRDGNTYYYNKNPNEVRENVFPDLCKIEVNSENLGKLKFNIISRYYYERTKGYSQQEHIGPLIGRMFKKFESLENLISVENGSDPENLEILNLKNVNLEMSKTLPLIIVKQLYNDHKKNNDYKTKSLHIIIDEAHNMLSESSVRESETWKDYRLEMFEELIKEGRKFSTFLTISSQRPNDISPTIISQLHNYFIHRLINDRDIRAIEKTVAYLDKLSFESIPILPVGSCFFSGFASDFPIKIDIELAEEQPNSETIKLEKAWNSNFNNF